MININPDEKATEKANPFWLHRIPDDRQCTAKSKRTRERCRRYACRDKTVCKHHGGKSTGPKVPSATHGESTLEAIKLRMYKKLSASADSELRTLEYGFAGWIKRRLETMDYPEFRRVRPALAGYSRGELSAVRLAAVIMGKPYKLDGMKSSCRA